MRPLRDYLLLELPPPVDKSEGGVHLPDTAADSEKPCEGYVRVTGPQVSDELRVGDRVRFSGFAGIPLVLEGKLHLFIREHDVLAIMEYAEPA